MNDHDYMQTIVDNWLYEQSERFAHSGGYLSEPEAEIDDDEDKGRHD